MCRQLIPRRSDGSSTLALDNPDVYYEKRDYPKIYQLYVQAAERGHWKAMLNLASLILSNYPGVPQHDPEAAIGWVEKAMQLGVPDAYDMMGTYHQNGMIKGGDATSAYAFFQRAADMGSPSALTFLGFKMSGSYDSPDGEFWGNSTIGMQMLQCALAQGYGDAAYELGGCTKGLRRTRNFGRSTSCTTASNWDVQNVQRIWRRSFADMI